MSALDPLKLALLNHMTGRATWTAPTTWHVALHTGEPGATGTDNELTGSGYARLSVAANAANWTAPTGAGGITENVNNLTYGVSSADWLTVSHFSIHSASTGAAGLVRQALVAPITILSGGVFQFAPGKLRVKVL